MGKRATELLVRAIDYIYDEVFQDTALLVRALRDIGFTWEEVTEYAAWISPETIKGVYAE